ncbi:UDP-N-acetyl glucosamine 2-epimerase [Synergistales bacterium]|nr:UDP-N-acetyl glucosamine 2-epimerase [Synergistales bacterium]
MEKKKICVVTGTRAEYGLLRRTMMDIANDDGFELQIAATGMHLSPEFGLTYKTIEEDGFAIDARVESLLSSDTPVGIGKSVGLGVIGFADAFERLRPDIALVLGDRYEILAAAWAAYIARIPIVHLCGGEVTEGAIDDAIRHSLTKLASLHVASRAEYAKRIVRLGEEPGRVFIGRGPTLEYIEREAPISSEELSEELGLSPRGVNFVVTYHPATLGEDPREAFAELLDALRRLNEAAVVFTYPNSDTGGRVIIEMIDKFVSGNESRARAFVSLGQRRYFGCLKYFDAVIGNSSSGIGEAPYFGIPTVNIGDRQKGRIKPQSVIDTPPRREGIIAAIDRALTPEFREAAAEYARLLRRDGGIRVIDIIKNNINILGERKTFYDMPEKPDLLSGA